MIFTTIERIRSLAIKISVFLTVCCVLTAVPSARVLAQTAHPTIEPVNVSAYPRVGEEARVSPPSKTMTKRADSLSLWSLQPAKQPEDTLFRLGKANSPAMGTVNQASGSSSSPEALATPKTGLSSDTSFPGGSDGSPNTRGTSERSSVASAPVHVLNGFPQNQTRQRFPISPLLKDTFGPITLRSKVHGLRSNLDLNRPEFGSISSSRKSLGPTSVQPALKRPEPQQKRSSSGVQSETRQKRTIK
jgi:hypothetical protein